ncbi:MAG: hypothetical protein AAGC85_07970, partial [Bacteroidota bacterium]
PFSPQESLNEKEAPRTSTFRNAGPTSPYATEGTYSTYARDPYNQTSNQPSGFESFVCVWEEAKIMRGLFDTTTIGKVFFGDVVTPVEQSQSRGDGQRYIKVEFQNGRGVGYIDEYYFEAESGPIAVLKKMNVYANPDVRSTFTGESFDQGDIAVVTDFDGEWIQLLAPQRAKRGWIRGFHNISIAPDDIRIAAMLKHARQSDRNYDQKRQRLEVIRAMPGFIQSPLAEMVRYELQNLERGDFYYPPPKEPEPEFPPAPETVDDFDKSNSFYSDKRSLDSDTRIVETFFDPNGQPYRKITETGSFQPVDGPKRPSSRYWCYHKDKPKGSSVLLERPNGTYLKLEVVNKLRQSNPAVIGLGEQVLREVFGNTFTQVKTVRITYLE